MGEKDKVASSVTKRRDVQPLDKRTAMKIATQIWTKLSGSQQVDKLKITSSELIHVKRFEEIAGQVLRDLRRFQTCMNFVPASLQSAQMVPPKGFLAERKRLIDRLGLNTEQLRHTCTSLSSVSNNTWRTNATATRAAVTPPAGRSQGKWLATIFRDIMVLPQHFSQCCYDAENKILACVTPDIILQQTNFGPFKIKLSLMSLPAERPYVLEPLRPIYPDTRGDVCHPHVQSGHLCEGDCRDRLLICWREGAICDAFLIIQQVLRNYNSRSPYVPLEKWHDDTELNAMRSRLRMHLLNRAIAYEQLISGRFVSLPGFFSVEPRATVETPVVSSPAPVASSGFADDVFGSTVFGAAQQNAPARPRARANAGQVPTLAATPTPTMPILYPTQVRERPIVDVTWCTRCQAYLSSENVVRCQTCHEGVCNTHRTACSCGSIVCSLCVPACTCRVQSHQRQGAANGSAVTAAS